MERKKRIIAGFAAFKYPDFRLLWVGQGISLIGTQMQMVGLNWQIYQLTGSAFALGILGLLRFVPILIFGLLAGTFVDIHNRKKILFVTQLTMTVLSLVLVITTFSGQINVWIIYAVSACLAATNAFDIPARNALMPKLVDRKDFANAISLGNIMFYISSITGPAFGGLVIARFGIGSVYLFNTISFLAVLFALFTMKTSGAIEGKTQVSASLASVVEGLTFVRRKTIIWSTMLLDFFSTFFASATALLPIYAQTILHVGAVGLGLLYAAQSVGAVMASLIMAQVGVIKRQGKVLLIAVCLYAVGTIIFGLSNAFWICFLGLFIVGVGDSVSAIIRNNVRQLATPDYIRGRMISVNMIFYIGGPQLGEFEAGILAGLVGAPLSVITGGVATLLVVGIMAVAIPRLRNYESQEEVLP